MSWIVSLSQKKFVKLFVGLDASGFVYDALIGQYFDIFSCDDKTGQLICQPRYNLYCTAYYTLTLWRTYVFITRRGTFLQICKVGDYRRSDCAILNKLMDSDTESNSLSICQFIF